MGGGKGYTESYPYQSDAAQAYRVSQYQHLQDDNIIYMAYDDIAYNTANPLQGQIVNWPTSLNGFNQV